MSSPPLFPDDDAELIPRRDRRPNSFSKPFEIRVVWLVLIGVGLLAWQISLNDWRDFLVETGNVVWLGALVPVTFLWWQLRRSTGKTRAAQMARSILASDDDEARPSSQVRLVEDIDVEPASWKLIMAMVGYLVAVLTLMVVALWRLLG